MHKVSRRRAQPQHSITTEDWFIPLKFVLTTFTTEDWFIHLKYVLQNTEQSEEEDSLQNDEEHFSKPTMVNSHNPADN